MDRSPYSFDLHVLGAPPAFVLSQDQTLRQNLQLQAAVEISCIAVSVVAPKCVDALMSGVRFWRLGNRRAPEGAVQFLTKFVALTSIR